jgi:DNA-binding response OmpR family regulator
VGKIFLIAADWQFRALVRAQLLEEGFEVRSWPSLKAALQDLVVSGEQADLTILDTKDLDFEVGATADLLRVVGDTPLILCGDALSQSSLSNLVAGRATGGQEGSPPARVLLRPFRIGDLIEEVRRIWACLGGEAKAGASRHATG